MAVPAAQPAKAITAKTPYFLFSEETRAEAKESILAGKEPGAKISVADVAKELGRRWKLLTDEERAVYKTRCQEAAAAAAAARAAAAGSEGEDPSQAEEAPAGAKAEAGAHAKQQGLPISLVKKIACLDEEVSRVSHEGVLVMARATELFLELLAERCANTLLSAKPRRTTIKLSDLDGVVKRDKRLVSAGLRDVLAMAQQQADRAAKARAAEKEEQADKAEADGSGAAGHEKGNTGPKAGKASTHKRKADQAAADTRPITSFFTKTAS